MHYFVASLCVCVCVTLKKKSSPEDMFIDFRESGILMCDRDINTSSPL